MKKLTIILMAAMLSGCGKKITGTVFGELYPAGGVLVATDISPKTVKTATNGYFKFRVRSRGADCRIMAWPLDDTTRTMTVDKYNFKAGPIDLRIRDRK